ncbi:MAG: glycosyltransferase, partial [Bacteroidales bacterium]
IPTPHINGVTLWTAHLPYRLHKYIIWLRAVIVCDILYLPKEELPKYIAFWKKLFGKKSFSTIEGVYSGSNYTTLVKNYGSEINVVKSRDLYDRNFSITSFMDKYNKMHLKQHTNGIIHLGIDTDVFKAGICREKLTDVIFIGNNMKYKGIEDYFEMAKSFSNLIFHIVGGGGNYDLTTEVAKRNLPNVILHGSLSHKSLSGLLEGVQLMFFPSRSEGFPKVTLECAAAGVPSIVYGDYGADEWITTGKDGFVVKTLSEAKAVIDDLINNPDKLGVLSKNAADLGKRFDWKSIIVEWETEIDKLSAK